MSNADAGVEAFQIAWRVLRATAEKKFPSPEDVEALQKFMPQTAGGTPDELACDVIQLAMSRRAELRRSR